MRQVSVRNKKQLQDIIVTFFSKYLINTEKAKYFKYFSTAVSILYANKGKGLKNLTIEQIKLLDYCISSMNRKRYNSKVYDAYTPAHCFVKTTLQSGFGLLMPFTLGSVTFILSISVEPSSFSYINEVFFTLGSTIEERITSLTEIN